jgi:hypothetical protein
VAEVLDEDDPRVQESAPFRHRSQARASAA